jgi:hypothetical protein
MLKVGDIVIVIDPEKDWGISEFQARVMGVSGEVIDICPEAGVVKVRHFFDIKVRHFFDMDGFDVDGFVDNFDYHPDCLEKLEDAKNVLEK